MAMMGAITRLSSSLPHTWEGEVREPLFTFSVNGETFGFFFFNIIQNVEVALVMGVTIVVAAAVACLLYQTVIAPQKQDTSFAYLLGYGLVVPFWIVAPMYVIQTFQITNKVFRFVMGSVPTVAIFRALEAIHGFSPTHATSSMGTFALYYSSTFIALYDAKKGQYVKASYITLLHKLVQYIKGMLTTGAIHSLYLLLPHLFIQFGEDFDKDRWYSWQYIFRWQTLWENLCFAAFFATYLSTCAAGLQLIIILVTGFQLEEMWVDPLSKSVSPSEFWGRRWNKTVHATLKGGVFKPVRRFFPKYVALAATFLASGLFHEWLVWVTFSPLTPQSSLDTTNDEDPCPNAMCFQPTYGPAIIFFSFQALLIAVEYLVGDSMKALTGIIPTPLATLLVICLGGSMAHWFSDAYVHSSFFLDAQVAYIVIKRI